MKWGAVDIHIERALIVGTGPSVAGVDIDVGKRVTIIAVNGAIEWLRDADIFFTLDPSVYVRGLIKRRREGVRYFAAIPDDYGQTNARVVAHRDRAEHYVTYLRRIEGPLRCGACPRLSNNPGGIHTGNSLYGALGLAYLAGARRIGILGLDGTQDGYAYSTARPRTDFQHLPALFESAREQLEAEGIEVRNGSPQSKVICWPKCEPSQLIKWLVD